MTREKETDVSCSFRFLHSSIFFPPISPTLSSPILPLLPMLLGIAYTLEKLRVEKYFSGLRERMKEGEREKNFCLRQRVRGWEEKLLPGNGKTELTGARIITTPHSPFRSSSVLSIRALLLFLFSLFHSPLSSFSLFLPPAMIPLDGVDDAEERGRCCSTSSPLR